MKHILFHDALREDFANEDENITTDLSGICINLIKDVHDESLEMTVEVFGKDGIHDAPIASEIICDPEAYLGKHFDRPEVCPRCLISLFEYELVNLLIEKGVKLLWNRDWQTEVIIDLANLHQTKTLMAEDQ